MSIEEKKQRYISQVHNETRNRGISSEEIPVVINKTGFMSVMEKYPEEKMHDDISDTVDDILAIASAR